jgi:hypothetical protein
MRGSLYYALDSIFRREHNEIVPWEVEFTDEFETWWGSLNETDQIKFDAAVRLLEDYGPDLPFLSVRV